MLIQDWKRAHKLNSIRLALFWGGLNGGVLALAAFQDVVNPWIFLVLNVAGYSTIAIARILKQPGID